MLDDPLCPVSSDVAAVLTGAVEALRKAGASLAEGWPQGMNVAQMYDTYLFLLNSAYAFALRDDRVEERRKRAENQDGKL